MISTRLLNDVAAGRVDGITAPVKGLDLQTAIAGLSPDYAIALTNWVCQPDALVTRGGAVNHATGFAQAPKSLMMYSSGTVTQMFAAASNGLFNVTAAGAIGASVSALTEGKGKSVNFATSAGQYLYFVNGVDNARLYDGATWVTVTAVSAPAITGPVTTTFNDVETYRARLYFLQNNFLGFYYLPADSVGGVATAFRVGNLCRLGGYVAAHGTWTLDSGTGPDDHYVLATSNGELVVFRGSDPAVAANWVYVGTYYVGKPTGKKSLVKFGGDLLYLCENGVIPLSTLVQSVNKNYAQALTKSMQAAIAGQFQLYGTIPGWHIHVIPKRNLVLLNLPQSTTTSIQYVYNSYSKAWSTFDSWNAFDFLEFGGETYFTTGSVVAKAFSGYADFGANIVATCDTSYNRFKTRNQLQPTEMRAIMATTGGVTYTLGLAQDFTGVYSSNTYVTSSSTGGIWDTGLWDTAVWGGAFTLRKDWVTIAARGGIALSTRFKVESNQSSTVLIALDYKFSEQGLIS